jgi:FkbM family methyltransferase
VQQRFSKIFRGYNGTFQEGKWRTEFYGKTILVPLRPQFAALDWDAALCVLGQDPELKQTYASLIQLASPPRLVLDIGANYGTHSIVFLINNIPVVPFEPNPACHTFFRLLCEVNDVHAPIVPLAMGSGEGSVDLWYPEGLEWLGTTDVDVKERLRGSLAKTSVRQTTLDGYVRSYGLSPDVLKIDTEGTEIQVLHGAAETLATFRPIVLFESWQASDRETLLSFFDQQNYLFAALPLFGSTPPRVLTAQQFRHDKATNFAGLPSEMVSSWPPRFGDREPQAAVQSVSPIPFHAEAY